MRFKAWSVNHLADDLKQQWIIRPYVYMRTHVKNPYVYQNLISLNSDSLYDSAINSIRPTLPALFITDANELCYVDMFTAKAKKKLPTPENMMGYYQLLNLNGEVVTPQEIICNYSFRKQTASSIFDTNYLFLYDKNEADNYRKCLVTNSNLMPLYDIEFPTKEIIEGSSTISVNPKITGCGQLTLADYWYDPYLLNEEHYFNNYSYYGAVGNVGKLFPEFNEDATAYNYDQLEFLKERRPYNLNKDATDVAEFIKATINTDEMENTEQTINQETSNGAALDLLVEYKYPKLNKIYYYDNTTKQRVWRYDPANKEDEAVVQIASICGLSPTESLLDLSSYVLYSTNEPFLTSYETYANLENEIEIGPLWFFWGVTAATDEGPWSTSYPSSETLLLSKLQVLSTSSAGDIISQSKENDPDTGEAVLTDDIMTIKVTMETQKLQYMVKKGIVVEENDAGEKYFVKYDVNIITAPRVGLYTGSSQVIARFKVQRYTGINFDNLTESSIITLYNNFGAKTTVTKYENSKDYFRFLYYLDSYTEIKDSKYTNNYRIYSENVKIYSRVNEDITITKTIAPGIIYDRSEWEYPGYTWKYNPSDSVKAFETKSIKKDFDYIKPLYYYINTPTELISTYNQSNIIAKTSFDRLKNISKGFVNSFTSVGESSSRQYGFNEAIQKGIHNIVPDRVFSHGLLVGKDFYTFKQQPCYNNRIPTDNPSPPSESELYTDPQSSDTKNYPRLNNSVHSTTKLFVVEQVNTDIKDDSGKEIANKKLIITDWDFSLEPPKSLVHPIPTQFTLVGPCYHSPVQAAAFKRFTSTITDDSGGYPYYGGSVSLYIDDLMMIYYIPSDPILNENDVSTIGSERTLEFHFKGINRDLGLTNAQRFKVLTEASNFSGSIDLINESDPAKPTTFPSSRLLQFSTNAKFGTYRLKITDDLEITKNSKTGETILRTDQSPLIKIWPRTLPIRYQQDTNGIFQKVSDWKLSFLPAPKSNYHLRFFRKEEPDELINLDEPFDPQYGIMRIKKIESTKTGDNDLDEVSMEVSFWNIAYNGSPYIPKKLNKKQEIVVEFNGVGSYPYYWYIVNTNNTSNVALLLPYIEKGAINKKKRKLVTLNTAGKFKLCVTDGAGIFYTSSEIEIE